MNEKRPAFKPAGIAGVGMTPQEIRDMQRIERMAQARGLYKSEPMLSQKSGKAYSYRIYLHTAN